MQAGDIGAETYQTIYDRLVKEGTAPDQAHEVALEKGRMAAAQAGAISVASSFIPGGKALERRFLTDAGKKAGFPGLVPAAGNVLGETIQEGTEEGGGKLASNIQVADVFPDTDIMKGVGAATGLGALGGGMFGGIANVPSAISRTPQVEPTPSGGAVPPTAGAVPPGAPPAVPPTPAVPLEAQLEETPAAVRLAELDRALKEVDLAFQNPNLSADDFSQLNAMAAQIKSQIAKIQAGEPVTAVTPPAQPVMPQAAAPEAPPVQVPEVPVVETPVAENLTVTPVTPEVAAPVEVAPTVKQDKATEKALRGINAAEVPLHEFQLGIIAGMEGKAPNPKIVSKDAVELLKANNLVKQNNDGTLTLLPLGNNLLNNIREFTKPMGKTKTADEQKALFSKFIPQLETGEPLVAPTEQTPVTEAPTVTPVTSEIKKPTEAQKRLDSFLSEDKDYIVKELAASYGVSPAYAEKAYNAEKEYREAEVKYHFPELINSPEFKAAYKKHTTFFNKLRAVSKKQKSKEDKVETNKARQVEKKAPKEAHIEGKKSEPVTSKTIEESIDKAADKVDYNKIKTAVKNQFDQAIKRAKIQTEQEWSSAKSLLPAEKFVTIDVPGDGKFKVKNNVERLKELQTKMVNATVPKVGKEPTGPSSGSVEAFKGMVDDKDMENAIEYAKLKGLDPKTVKLTPAQRSTVDNYLKNPAEFERQTEEAGQMAEARQEALRADQEKRIAERLAADEEREEEARFKAVIDTTIASTEAQLKRDIAAKKISTKDARRMVEVFPNYPEGTLKPYTIRLIEKRAGAEPSFKQLRKNVTEDGQLLDHPLINELVNTDKYEMLDLRNPRTYVDKGGIPHRTFERNGVRIALTLGEKLFQTKGKENQAVQTGIGDNKDVHFNALLVDPQERRQGKATRALNTIRHIADRHELKVYLEPAEMEKNGITKAQLTDLYAKFQFKPTNEVGKIMLREPESYSVMMDRINAEMKAEGKESEYSLQVKKLAELKKQVAEMEAKKAAGLSDDSRTIDVEATEITPSQMKLLTNQVNKLSDADIATLEEHYGVANYSMDFMKRIGEDIITYTNKGAEAVDKAIRSIIAKLQAGMLSVAIVFNPAYMSEQSAVVFPAGITTERVMAVVPESANAMSEGAKKAYATLYPALRPEMLQNNKYFTVVDKPESKVYVFNPDGSLMTKSNVVLGKALGDVYVGQTQFKENQITPAGLIKAKAEKGSATYDGKTVYTFGNVQEGWNAVFMHTVYLKESDAETRKKALDTGKNTRLSHGCINGPTDLMAKIDNESMDGSHVFIVPDNQAAIDDYIANNVSNEDLTRETVTPVTQQVPAKQAAGVRAPQIVGREEKAIEPKTQAQINSERQMAKLSKDEPPGTFYNNFEPDFTESDFNHSVDDVRKELIKEQAANSRKITKSVKKVANMGSDLATQYELNRAIAAKKALTEEIESMKQPKTLPEDVMARAAKERAEFQRTSGMDGLSPEAYAVLEALYKKQPYILNGLKLSVRKTERRGVTGSFEPMERLVTIYKKGISAIFGGGGEQQAKTMRHEIAHSLEQMMDSDAKQVLVNAWANSLQKAIKKHEGDKVYQDYFDAVLDFIENPNQSTYDKATNLMPEYSMYQYINPSEYWAVNAEPLLNAQLGGAWTRFTKAVKGLWEAIKSVFGFDNRYAVHREFNRIMSGDQQRINKQMLVDYLDQTGVSKKFINNIEEERNLVEDLNLPEVPDHQERSMKDMAVAGYRRMQEWGKEFGSNPGKTATKSLISASDAITKQRIENVYFAAGLDKRDQDRYNGQIKAADGFMAASIAIKNAIHSAHISTQVIIEGGIEYSKEFGQIVAKKAEHSMANVVKLEHAIKQKLGDKLGLQIVNGYFIAKRSRSIQNEFLDASAALQKAQDSGDFAQIAEAQSDYNSIKTAYGKIPNYFRQLDQDGKPMYETIYGEDGEALGRIPILNDEAIDRAIGMEKLHPELKQMMENWTAVNQNMLDIMAFSGRISKKSAEKLKAIKDYVPWYRIMDDQENIHDGSLVSNMPGGPRRFKAGETERDIDNVVESMIHNVVMMTRGATKTYAINRVISEYGQRYEEGPKKGKLMVFPSEGRDAEGTRIASFIGGRRVITNIPDDLVADSVIGLIAAPFTFPLQEVLGAAANGFRRSITFTPWFQVKQLIIDAPTAAWVSGVRNPFKLWAGVFSGFVNALEITGDDPVVQILRNAGVGGFQSFHRSAKKEREIQLGLLKRSNYAAFLNAIDKVGDASDLAQRVSVYKRVLAEKGDPALALLQASDIIDFQKHGKGRLAQAMRTTVTFMQAYATQLDALAQASVGGNLKGVSRAEAKKQFRTTGMLLASTTLMYVMMAAADDDYWELDDQTRLRNFYIPGSKKATGHHILIPMTTSAAFFFKAVPELAHNFIVSQGTKNEMDKRRTAKALGAAAVDALLGPSPVPTGVKPIAEIAFNHDFYTGGNVVPKGLEGLDSAEQYNATTSNLGHAVSKLSAGALNPIQADHLMRGIGGSVAALGMYFSNLAFPDDRPAPELRQNPIIGNLVGPEVSRKNEELFYDLREKATGKYKTYQSMMENDRFEEADKFYEKNQGLIDVYEYVSSIDTDLKEINKEVRRLGKSSDKSLTPAGRTKDINELKRLKSDMLEDITEFRKEAGF
jgi:hypothetical protein